MSINLMNAREISETTLLSEKPLEKDWNVSCENEAWQYLEDISTIK